MKRYLLLLMAVLSFSMANAQMEKHFYLETTFNNDVNFPSVSVVSVPDELAGFNNDELVSISYGFLEAILEDVKVIQGNYEIQRGDSTILYTGTDTTSVISTSSLNRFYFGKVRIVLFNTASLDFSFETINGTNDGQYLDPGVYVLVTKSNETWYKIN